MITSEPGARREQQPARSDPARHGGAARMRRAPVDYKRASKRGTQCSAPGDERASVPGPVVLVGGRCLQTTAVRGSLG
jgi:hypothetical protein